MKQLMKNHLYRAKEHKGRILIMLSLSFVAICLALWMTNTAQEKMRIAIIGDQTSVLQSSESVTFVPLENVPKQSVLIQGMYDGVILFEAEKPVIIFAKNDKISQKLEQVISVGDNKRVDEEQQKGMARNILGYVLMFLLMLGVFSTFLYTEDKEKHRLERLLYSSITLRQVFCSYTLFIFGLLWIPSLCFLGSLSFIFQVNLGLSFTDYAILLGVLSLLGSTFALCNASFFDTGDQSNMMGSMLVLLTSLISGNFFSIPMTNRFWEGVTRYLPQKQFISLVTNLEQGESYRMNSLKVGYLIGMSLLFFGLILLKNRQNYYQTK